MLIIFHFLLNILACGLPSINDKKLKINFKNISNNPLQMTRSTKIAHKDRWHTTPYVGNTVHLSNGKYINASNIMIARSSRVFIATQAPLPETLSEFWMMVWEKNVRSILNLNHKRELTEPHKWEKYIPKRGERIFYRRICVETIDERLISNTTKHYRLKLSCGEFERYTEYVHYDEWVDQGTISSDQLLQLVANVNRIAGKTNSRPIIVHCSAGRGRTGTFIAASYAVEIAKRALHPSCVPWRLLLLNLVNCLRVQRRGMIQNWQQFRLLLSMIRLYSRGK